MATGANDMNESTRLPQGNSSELPRELQDLSRCILELPIAQQQSLEVAFTRVTDSFNRRRRILSLVQDALSQLRLDVKYLMFDLEITQSERDALKEQLEEEF